MWGGMWGCGLHIRGGVGIQKTAGIVAPSTPIWRGCSDHLLFSPTHTHFPHHHRAFNINKATVCLNYRSVTSLPPSLPSLPVNNGSQWLRSREPPASADEVVIVLIWVPHAELDSHWSGSMCNDFRGLARVGLKYSAKLEVCLQNFVCISACVPG